MSRDDGTDDRDPPRPGRSADDVAGKPGTADKADTATGKRAAKKRAPRKRAAKKAASRPAAQEASVPAHAAVASADAEPARAPTPDRRHATDTRAAPAGDARSGSAATSDRPATAAGDAIRTPASADPAPTGTASAKPAPASHGRRKRAGTPHARPASADAPAPPRKLFETALDVRWGDMDAFNHVNNARFLGYLEEARLRWLQTLAGPWLDDNTAPVLAATHVNYRRPIEWPATLAIELYAERVGGSSVTLGHRISDRRDPTIVYSDGHVVMVWIDRRSGRGSTLPQAVRTAAGG
jgi:acyl-CoA thioester hydrolase